VRRLAGFSLITLITLITQEPSARFPLDVP